MRETAGIILAGGLSRRMGGGDKSLGMLDGRPLMERVVGRIRPQVSALAINANGDPSRFAGFGLPLVPDTVEGFAGPLAGVLAGIEWAARNTGADRLLTVAGDTPFFPTDLAVRLAQAVSRRPQSIALASSGGRNHPTFALWPIGLADDLRSRLVYHDERRVTAFIERHEHVAVDFPLPRTADMNYDPFFNINTPQDLAEAERLAQAIET
jgi:molybdopterin-guanine dinucleotide biosynthesis protein A